MPQSAESLFKYELDDDVYIHRYGGVYRISFYLHIIDLDQDGIFEHYLHIDRRAQPRSFYRIIKPRTLGEYKNIFKQLKSPFDFSYRDGETNVKELSLSEILHPDFNKHPLDDVSFFTLNDQTYFIKTGPTTGALPNSLNDSSYSIYAMHSKRAANNVCSFNYYAGNR